MDPRDRLWVDLIFPHCDVAALLASRAVCRQLNAAPARLWTPLTMVAHRMSYAERVLGWPGVPAAMAREERTRVNCDAGRFTCGPTLQLPEARILHLVSGRIAAVVARTAQLFDADTGALVASFEVGTGARFHQYALCDRWVAVATGDRRVQLLDCVAARLVQVESVDYAHQLVGFSTAGPCVSYHNEESHSDVTVMHVSGGPDGATVVREVARVPLSDLRDQFALCERGRSYLVHGHARRTLQLFDLATRQCKLTWRHVCDVAFAVCSTLTGSRSGRVDH